MQNNYFNPFFIARETELALWKTRLTDSLPLCILNIYGHSGVGKTWLLGAFRDTCRETQVPFAQLDAYRLGEDLSPPALLKNLATQLELNMRTENGMLIFDRLLPRFVTALAEVPYPTIAIMVDDYDQLFHLIDPWLRHLFRAICGVDQFTGLPSSRPTVSLENLPRILAVINSHSPLSERWPPNPLYHQALEMLPLSDFSFSETCDYLTRRGIAEEHHQQLFRLTQGHALALALVVSVCKRNSLPPVMPETTDKVMQYLLTWALRDVDDTGNDSQVEVMEMLRASALVRRFNQPLLATMLDQTRLPDDLFDQVSALSMVIGQKQSPQMVERMFSGSGLYVLHDVLRTALIEDAQRRGLGEQMDEYRRRALMFYMQRLSGCAMDTLGEDGLDILFLHRDSLIHDMFFGWSSAMLISDHVSYDEMKQILVPSMRDNFYYQMLGFSGKSLERLIRETQAWLSLDHELHGDKLRYFRVVRRGSKSGQIAQRDIAGFVLNVPITEATLPYLRQETMGMVYEVGCGPIESREDIQAFFSLRLVADGLDSLSALLRTVFVQMSTQSFDTLLTVMPWSQLSSVLEAISFDVLAHQVEYEGYPYDIIRLDVGRLGGAAHWLFRLVRKDLGLPARSLLQNWNLFKEVLQEALEQIHDSFDLLAKSPLIDEFALVERTADDWKRG